MMRGEIERELQIYQREILATASRQSRANPVKRLGRAALRRIDQWRHLLAGLGLAQSFLHQWVPWQLLFERLIDRGRRGIVLVARQPARIIVGDARRGIVYLVG